MDAGLKILMASPGEAEIVSKSISVDEKPGFRSSFDVSADCSEVKIKIKAEDLGALRAALNSKLREVKIASSLL